MTAKGRYTAAEDKAIRAGMAAGKSLYAIARELGRKKDSVEVRMDKLSRLPVKHRSKRKCMCCGAEFSSEGAHNRLCDRCRLKSKSCFEI